MARLGEGTGLGTPHKIGCSYKRNIVHKIERKFQNPNWKEKLSSIRWHNFLPMQKRVAPKLKKIICVSKPSKEDVIEEFNVDPNKIEVIHQNRCKGTDNMVVVSISLSWRRRGG